MPHQFHLEMPGFSTLSIHPENILDPHPAWRCHAQMHREVAWSGSKQKTGKWTNPLTRFASAEGGRFELPVPCGTLVFKTSAFGHSAIPPVGEL